MEDKESKLILTLQAFGAIIMLAVALSIAAIIAVFVWGVCVGMWNGMQAEFTITPEEQAKIDQSNKDWETDARNPKVAGKACIDKGGIPRYSNWDGEVFDCIIPEVKQ